MICHRLFFHLCTMSRSLERQRENAINQNTKKKMQKGSKFMTRGGGARLEFGKVCGPAVPKSRLIAREFFS